MHRRALTKLSSDDLLWLAHRIHEYRDQMKAHTRWKRRLEMAIDNLLWAASVDAAADHGVVQDGWVRSGLGLDEAHFDNVPHTAEAQRAFDARELKLIKREHVVPRARLLRIVCQTERAEDTSRVLDEYARVALVHKVECARLLPISDMPADWDNHTNWRYPPTKLPDVWARYRQANPPVVPRMGGQPVF